MGRCALLNYGHCCPPTPSPPTLPSIARGAVAACCGCLLFRCLPQSLAVM
jgi:hypothetical protein